MDYTSVLQDSIDTSVSMKLFKSRKEASEAHIFQSTFMKIPLSTFTKVDNFNPERLQESAVKAYPLDDRPRGAKDISSVKYYQKEIELKREIQPIWLYTKNKKYILLDGAHRIVASYIEHKKYIYAYVISI
jgi:hypothetical protein